MSREAVRKSPEMIRLMWIKGVTQRGRERGERVGEWERGEGERGGGEVGDIG